MKRVKRRDDGGCPRCLELQDVIRKQEEIIRRQEGIIRRQTAELTELRQRVRQLESRLNRCSRNSSIPPSKDPPNAPPRPKKKPTGRRRGAQPGHKGNHRDLLPVEEADRVFEHIPSNCNRCGHPLPQTPGPEDPPPLRHQVWEIPEKLFVVLEHRAHGRACPNCGFLTWAEIPPAERSVFGPRLTALLGYLTGALKLSRRRAQKFATEVLHIPISLGALSELEKGITESLAEAYAEARQAVRGAQYKNVDETGWKNRGKKCWLWVAATASVVFYVISPSRGKEGFKKLLDRTWGFITSDRSEVYAAVKARWRQICWAHLQRDFRRLSEQPGVAGEIGRQALEIAEYLFLFWHDFREGVIGRQTLKRCLRTLKADLHELLQRGAALELKEVSAFAKNLLALEPALWNFAEHEGLEPTNNHAERVIRPAVIWRKTSFGADSDRGLSYVERMMTVVETCRLQKRSVYEFLLESIRAFRSAAPPPKLISQAN